MLLLQGRISPLIRDPQPRVYLSIAVLLSLVIVAYHEAVVDPRIFETAAHAFKDALFNIISIMTGT